MNVQIDKETGYDQLKFCEVRKLKNTPYQSDVKDVKNRYAVTQQDFQKEMTLAAGIGTQQISKPFLVAIHNLVHDTST